MSWKPGERGNPFDLMANGSIHSEQGPRPSALGAILKVLGPSRSIRGAIPTGAGIGTGIRLESCLCRIGLQDLPLRQPPKAALPHSFRPGFLEKRGARLPILAVLPLLVSGNSPPIVFPTQLDRQEDPAAINLVGWNVFDGKKADYLGRS